jgi:homoserine dehydrogenase
MAKNAISRLNRSSSEGVLPVSEAGPQTVILVTHATTESRVRAAVDAIKSEGYLSLESRR